MLEKEEMELLKEQNLLLKEQLKEVRELKKQNMFLMQKMSKLIKSKEDVFATFSLEELVVSELSKLSVPKSYKGYFPLVDAICILVEDKDCLYNMSALYSFLADKYQCHPHTLERNFENIIKCSIQNCDASFLDSYFRNVPSLTVSEFIASVSIFVRIKFNKQKAVQKQMELKRTC